MIKLEYKQMYKNPLHLLVDERLKFPDKVEKDIQELWQTTSNPGRDEIKLAVKERLEFEGREVLIMGEVNFRHIYAMLVNYSNLEQGLNPPIPGFHLSLANPIGKFQIPSPEGVFQTQSLLGQDRARNQLSAIGGHLDIEDFTECTLPNGMRPIAPFRADGQLDIKTIIEMCRAMDEAEQQLAKIDCPATRCVLREGEEEGGIKCYTPGPIGKCEKIYISPLGGKRYIEEWPVYSLIPEKEKTFKEILQSFNRHDRILKAQQGERELSSLESFNNHLPDLTKLLESRDFDRMPKRPSVVPVLTVERNYQETLAKWRLQEARRPSVPFDLHPDLRKSPFYKQAQETLREALKDRSVQLPVLEKEDARSRS